MLNRGQWCMLHRGRCTAQGQGVLYMGQGVLNRGQRWFHKGQGVLHRGQCVLYKGQSVLHRGVGIVFCTGSRVCCTRCIVCFTEVECAALGKSSCADGGRVYCTSAHGESVLHRGKGVLNWGSGAAQRFGVLHQG